MKTLIKHIRDYLNMSQTEFAELLSVTFATVNRWENGRAVPNKLAQTTLYEICKDNSVPVYDITLNRIANVANYIVLPNNRIILYHGSKSGIEGKVEPISRSQCDFGKGFYMGTDPSQAPAATMKRNYMMFHTMDPVLAIEDLKEISQQKK